MKRMGLYKHWNNTDVAILVLNCFYIRETNDYKIKVRWMNIVNPNNIFDAGIKETLRIPSKVFNKDWLYLK